MAGVVIGAIAGATAWVVPSFAGALFVWMAIVAFGVGGTVRTWLHSTRDVQSETS
ncbi:hypothetical protein VB773_15470 [Haloarculaceae archaeon H-GB2-1]|nr:hypothetical protein [Haloarculaceae archaeon H-GB11]MEA5408826.1 hypothetical protein [Haloarculaceae archaeon H-GB2-1]